MRTQWNVDSALWATEVRDQVLDKLGSGQADDSLVSVINETRKYPTPSLLLAP